MNYTFLKVVWWMIIGSILVVYASTAGFDSGVTMIMPFLRNETQRRILLNTSAPVWDGNLTWILFAGGGLFVVWPVVYSTAFSGLYLILIFIMWSLFLRPPGYDYRGKLPSPIWRRSWDVALFISSIVPVFFFGLAFDNCLLGFPFHFDSLFRDYYTGSWFELFNGFGILSGTASVLMVLMHGSAYIQRRTEGDLRELGRRIHYIATVLLTIAFSVAGLLVLYRIKGYTLISYPKDATIYPLNNVVIRSVGAWLNSYNHQPWKYFGPIFAYLGIILTLLSNFFRWYTFCFWSSALAIMGLIGTIGFTLFPFIMPSSTAPDQSLTVWNATSSQYGLNVMLYVGVILFIVILGYNFMRTIRYGPNKKPLPKKIWKRINIIIEGVCFI
ncbi:cytochrome d ubiquinol oxidase subunit II [Coxiella burnetii]|uniref:cytochrome d ubiquinol oxidase subunit II n=1 Tax=Coxiella burnetii TaxID=777 RepID=UPI0021764A95|nr:cytochrome d ubiquinol oxidase subunit II [Coxiella burnetii]